MNKPREIKFRGWNKTLRRFIPNFEPFWVNINDFSYINGGAPEWQANYDVEFQQFTGRKDSKGTQIYEGDIVNVSGGLHIIEWRGAGFAATWSDYNLDTCWFVGGGPIIVGNICENPDLAERARKGPRN